LYVTSIKPRTGSTLPSTGDWKPNEYVNGRSGSDQSNDAKRNDVDNSVPFDGVTAKTPGTGGPFVVMLIDEEEAPQENDTVYVDISANTFDCSTRLTTLIEPGDSEGVVLVSATEARMIDSSSILHAPVHAVDNDTVAVIASCWVLSTEENPVSSIAMSGLAAAMICM
jgi:hypothetical protein